MVKQKIHIKVGKTTTGKYKVSASNKPNAEPMWSSTDKWTRKALPTAKFAIEVNIPNEKFELEGEVVAKINFDLDQERLIVKTVEAL